MQSTHGMTLQYIVRRGAVKERIDSSLRVWGGLGAVMLSRTLAQPGAAGASSKIVCHFQCDCSRPWLAHLLARGSRAANESVPPRAAAATASLAEGTGSTSSAGSGPRAARALTCAPAAML